MQKQMSNLMFRLMSAEFRVKSMFRDLRTALVSVGIAADMVVLDFGCGPGRYTIPAAGIVGTNGKVYALDIHPLAIRSVERLARRRSLERVETLLSDGAIPLADASVDAVILYDTLHDVDNRNGVVREITRVLKTGGLLLFRDHHLAAESAFKEALENGLLARRSVEGPITTYIRREGLVPASRPNETAGASKTGTKPR